MWSKKFCLKQALWSSPEQQQQKYRTRGHSVLDRGTQQCFCKTEDTQNRLKADSGPSANVQGEADVFSIVQEMIFVLTKIKGKICNLNRWLHAPHPLGPLTQGCKYRKGGSWKTLEDSECPQREDLQFWHLGFPRKWCSLLDPQLISLTIFVHRVFKGNFATWFLHTKSHSRVTKWNNWENKLHKWKKDLGKKPQIQEHLLHQV